MTLYLQHVGVLGMKWGHRKGRSPIRDAVAKVRDPLLEKDKAYRSDMKFLATSKNVINKSDKAKFQYAQQNLINRLGASAGPIVLQYAIRQTIATAFLGQKLDTSPKGLLKIGAGLAKNTAISFAISEAAAKSASTKYGKDGNLKSGKKGKKDGITREDAALLTAQTAIALAPYAKYAATTKLHSVLDKRRANKERFEKWGSNILSSKVDTVVWQSPDLSTAVIDNAPSRGWH